MLFTNHFFGKAPQTVVLDKKHILLRGLEYVGILSEGNTDHAYEDIKNEIDKLKNAEYPQPVFRKGDLDSYAPVGRYIYIKGNLDGDRLIRDSIQLSFNRMFNRIFNRASDTL